MYKLEPLDGINGITSMLFDNRKALLIGTGVVLTVTAAYLIFKKPRKAENTAISQPAPQQPALPKNTATLTI